MNMLSFKHLMKHTFARVIIALAFTVIIVGIIGYNRVGAEKDKATKHFVTITVMPGDTLWSIAEENITEEYDDINDYIKEIKSTNCLNSSDITAGRHIIIPIYTY